MELSNPFSVHEPHALCDLLFCAHDCMSSDVYFRFDTCGKPIQPTHYNEQSIQISPSYFCLHHMTDSNIYIDRKVDSLFSVLSVKFNRLLLCKSVCGSSIAEYEELE